MEDQMYGFPSTAEYSDKAPMTPENLIFPAEYHSYLMSSVARIPMFVGSDELLSAAASGVTVATEAEPSSTNVIMTTPQFQRHSDGNSCVMKAKIASHPHYPRLLQAYIDCQKVGAPPEIAYLLEEIQRENDLCKRDVVSTCLGADPELDEFMVMETYCEMLEKYKCDLTRPFDEATSFLNKIEMQLSNLCTASAVAAATSSPPPLSDEGGVSSEEELSGGDGDCRLLEEDRQLKDRLLRKFGSHISTLKLEFSKKKKRGKLPKDARQSLLHWWNSHYKWPYPTEADKIALAKSTGLDQKQINNWFINQRKRHWKPSENMQFNFCDGHII